MTSASGTAISIAGGEITIDAGLLASKLALSAGWLEAEMRMGVVSSVAEIGIDEDVGRTHFAFRSHSRTWTVVIDPDGNLVESISRERGTLPANTDRVTVSDLARIGS